MQLLSTVRDYINEFFEELILLGIILLNILDFLELVNPDLDYIKKIISFAAVAYLIYRAGLTRIFFGVRKKFADLALVLAYFLFSMKNLVAFSRSAIHELSERGAEYWAIFIRASAKPVMNITTPLQDVDLAQLKQIPLSGSLDHLVRMLTIPLNDVYVKVSNNIGSAVFSIEPRFMVHRWHNFILDHSFLLQKCAIAAGLLILAGVAFYFTYTRQISGKCIMQVLGINGGSLRSVIAMFVVLSLFYVSFIALVIEWLVFAIDAPLLVIAVFVYLLLWIKHHNRFDPDSIIFKAGNVGDEFYQKFISLFFSRRGMMLALSGMLVLHLLTDIANFLLPYILGLQDPLYFSTLGPGHTPIFSVFDVIAGTTGSMMLQDISIASGTVQVLSIAYLYLMNVCSALLLFSGPAILWYLIFKGKEIYVPRSIVAFFFSSVSVLLLAPAFALRRIGASGLTGVDILTESVLSESIISPFAVLLISLAVLLLAYVLASLYKRATVISGSILLLLFYSYYIFLFFTDLTLHQLSVAAAAFAQGQVLFSFFIGYFFLLSAVFFIAGLLSYVFEVYSS